MDITHQPANPSTMVTTNSRLRLDGPSTMGNCQVSWRVHNGYISLNHVEQLTDHPTTAQPSTYTYPDTLRRDCHDGMPSAVAFMQGLQDFTEECLHEQAEW